jgi:hypothetical protein
MNNEARRRKGSCGVDLISDALPFGRLWYANRTRSAIQLATPNIAAVHVAL